MEWEPDKRENTGRGPGLIASARIDELRERAEAGDKSCTYWYLWLLRKAGRIEPMRAFMEAGAYRAAEMVIAHYCRRRDLGELRALTQAGYEGAARELAWVARDLGEADVLRELAATGDSWAAYLLATLLADRGELAEIRAYLGGRDPSVRKLLVKALTERGEIDEAIEMARALPRDDEALPALLARRGAIDELRAGAAEGLHYYLRHLADLLVERGEIDELRSFTDSRAAQSRLARHYRETGNEAELVTLADTGSWHCEDELLKFYRERGDVEGLRRRTGRKARDALVETLADQGAVAELWELAREGHGHHRLGELLKERRDVDGLRELAAIEKYGSAKRTRLKLLDEEQLRAEGTKDAQDELAMRVVRRGDLTEMLAYDWPDTFGAPYAFVKVLVEHGMEDELRRRAADGFSGATTGLHDLLLDQGREDELLGDPAGEKALAWRMVNKRRFEDLLAWAERGSVVAGEALWDHLDPGDPNDEERLSWA
ncbi:hypothetical protein [Amycolatopsis suaedae]|uniref:Uncharacterized protein n=1 Tax=Amycolatopsis suaedae TaxID=2510978 RepID=A0A4Q7JCQ2_9PSEU|nr:hypothetical protein [Amycolatopsis suaedae]RZQ64343.1 hypothetical protein EWH70_10255 [Amycolatopsis suaedae]